QLRADVRYHVWCAVVRTELALHLLELDRQHDAQQTYNAALSGLGKIGTEPRLSDAVRQSEQVILSVQPLFAAAPSPTPNDL
ncbi:MAG: hypothetical protein KF861_22490, partial [Planctomycetaceae bacterium]|nr:hypothetical protein [Planctomycetaceae bacterium]